MKVVVIILVILMGGTVNAAQLCIEVPDKEIENIVDDLSEAGGYEPMIIQTTPVPNPVSREDFAHNIIKRLILEVITQHRTNKASEMAGQLTRATIAAQFADATPTPRR